MPKTGVLLREFIGEARNCCNSFTLIYAQGRLTVLYGTTGDPKYNGEYKLKRIIEKEGTLQYLWSLCLALACQNLLW